MPKFPINLGGYSTEELIELNETVVALIKTRRRAESARVRHTLGRGDKVSFTNRTKTYTGTIEKVMRTRCIVNVDGARWRCHLTTLTRIND